MRQLALALSPPPEPSLDNFVVGPNAELLERLRAAAAGAQTEAVLYLWGAPGSGRSHLLRAAVAAASDGAYARHGIGAVAARLAAIDDVERLEEPEQVALFSLINRAREGAGVVLAAGPCPPGQLALREDLRSRLGWGLVYQLHAPRDADKAAHLRVEAARRGIELSDAVVDYLLSRLPRDLRSLVTVIDLLDRHALERQRPVTLALARAALRDPDEQPG